MKQFFFLLWAGVFSTTLAHAGIIFNVTEYSSSTMSFDIAGTSDEAYDSNQFDSLLQIATDFNLSEPWNSSVSAFTGSSTVGGVINNTWNWANNGSDTGFSFYYDAGGFYSSILPAGTVFDINVTATGVFDAINYSASDFGVYLGNAAPRLAQNLLASANTGSVPLPSVWSLMAIGLLVMVGIGRRKVHV